ncbi:HAD-IIIC family phosphatase [Solwaraspora sp. WMMB335]|uniref:HAD-IIIC family phosphatase n=1 Tax=Solwaraspora sp. WMMB335 TaxID=3404118 RepID=UPI003B95AF34
MAGDRTAVVGGAAGSPLTELRALIRGAGSPDTRRVRRLLDELTDVLDVEAAGGLLRRASAGDRLAGDGALVPTRVAVLGSTNLDLLPPLLTAAGARRGLLPEVRTAGFDQWRLEIAAGAPHLADLRPRIVALILDDAAVLAGVTDATDVDAVAARCAAFPDELSTWLSACRSALDGLAVLTTVPLSPLRRHRLISYAARARLDAAWSRMNAAIADLAGSHPATVVLAAADLAERAGVTFAGDRMRHVAAHTYAPEYLLAYAEELARVAAADLGLAAKCLVLDLDDTVWGGVVGDAGPAGVRLGGGYPGSAHVELQALARDLSAQGVLLAIASKNDRPVAEQAIAAHPEMVLRPDAFAASRIDWAPKPDNVRAMADELNIGADALVFVDDNPVERDLMRQLAPAVRTVELPADPAGYARTLAARGDFAVLTLTDEDRHRAATYQAGAQRRALADEASSLDDYLMGLGCRLTVEPRSPVNTDRIVQLFGKTNQFNLSGVRYGAAEVAAEVAADAAPDGALAFFAARLVDRFGDNGLIAALALRRRPDGAWSIDNFVLSCRVFSRDVEGAITGLVLRSAVAHGVPAVFGTYRGTERNARFADFYPRLGFRPVGPAPRPGTDGPAGPRVFRHDLTDLADLPAWIEITHDEEAFHVP